MKQPKSQHLLFCRGGIVFAKDCEDTVAQQPGFDINIIDKNDDGAEDADDAEVFNEFVFLPECMKHSRRGAVAKAPAEPADSPFNPHQRQSDDKERDKIRNHKSAAAVTCRLNRKPQEIAEAYRAAGHGEDYAYFASPSLFCHPTILF